jgi:hypothetical protein
LLLLLLLLPALDQPPPTLRLLIIIITILTAPPAFLFAIFLFACISILACCTRLRAKEILVPGISPLYGAG